ncbi:MAG: alkaline phosphatase family protein, partial [Anaerolineae bacterium]|nr:alkaline phosphatase family protein [Anaerolineae bacterium]
SMLGGMTPDKHGIYWNTEDTGLGKINGPTVFTVAREAGLRTAMVVGKPKLEDLVLPNSVEQYNYAGFTDNQVTAQAVTIINNGLPNLLFIHLPDVDSTGHATGWLSVGQLLALSWTDGRIGEILAALESTGRFDQTLLIITADHGGSGNSHGSASAEDTVIPWLAVGPGILPGSTAPGDIVTYDTAATALHALDLAIPDLWDGRPITEIFNDTACQS